ncbi:Peptide-N4-(N-acetyl-beta-glucosaminyl)asparagine amidase A [Sesamum alatum]|uniref:Peptide-N4-(N-acetyl-beta-glucosaminyl)asparagine amidase A n=1 Tax=Sesamum alatum TaxID=300844 RepID=A0AAE1YP41_9LAMI|nr:Peptide-N4-(N-acetyl-beta-glucosaminyl)asparagine amidase A [Sesamum alatum]
MHPSLLLLLLLTLIPPLSASSPPPHHSHLTKNRLHLRKSTTPPQEYIEVTRPLPSDSLTPSCTLPVLSHSFGNTINLPPTNTTYSPPRNCTWSRVVLHLSAASNGSQYDRIAAVWLSGAELLRTSTPEPTPEGIFWNVRKDVTRYSSLLRQSNLTLSVMLENIVNDVYTGVYRVNLTFLYYDVAGNGTTYKHSNFALPLISPNRKSTIRKLKDSPPVPPTLKSSLELDENPADLIIPISAIGDEGFWFRIESESDAVYQGIQIPLNTYRAVIEVYVSFHGNDEFWYSNPPDSYIEMNGLPTKRGHGAYREVLVKLDDNVVGSVVPFPVIFTGGINPLFWEPVVSIGAFDLPSYEIELTPFLGLLLDGRVHYFGLGVADAISFWLVDANLHLWLDDNVDKVQAGPIKYNYPSRCVERESEFQQLDGKFEIEGKRETEFSGWVNSTAGNFTTYLWSRLKFENTIKFNKNGTEKDVKQKVKVTNEVKVESASGASISSITVKRKYPLRITTSTLPGSGKDTYLMITKLEHSLEEEKQDGNFESTLDNSQKSSGWMFVQDHDVLSGAATTYQSYDVEDSFGCFTRQVLAENGSIKNETKSFLCARAATS